jgi:hypothetical protein
MLNENDLQEFLLIAEDDISEQSWRNYPKSSKIYIEGKAKAKAAKNKKAKGAADKKVEDETVEADGGAAADDTGGPKPMSILQQVKAIQDKGEVRDKEGKLLNPDTVDDVLATNINRKNSAGNLDTRAIVPSANLTGKVSGKAPTSLGRKAAASADDDLARQGIRGGDTTRRQDLAKDLADMRADRKSRPKTKGELARDYAARQPKQSMREALEDVWRNGATVQENLRSSKDKGMRVLRTGKTMTGGRPAVIETNPKDPTSRNMGMTNEEADAQGESFDAVDATSNFLSNISKDDSMYSWSLSTKK